MKTISSIIVALLLLSCEPPYNGPGTPEELSVMLINTDEIMLKCGVSSYADTLELFCSTPASGGFHYLASKGQWDSPYNWLIGRLQMADFNARYGGVAATGTYSFQIRGTSPYGTSGWSPIASINYTPVSLGPAVAVSSISITNYSVAYNDIGLSINSIQTNALYSITINGKPYMSNQEIRRSTIMIPKRLLVPGSNSNVIDIITRCYDGSAATTTFISPDSDIPL